MIFHDENDKTPTLSLVECKLETGRTHQIRVHMTHMGNSIVGDDKYKKKFNMVFDEVIEFRGFSHPDFQSHGLSKNLLFAAK
mgnify:CR=1 FL=1